VCGRMCLARLPDPEEALPHVSQRWGFSSACVYMCTVRSLDVEKALPHASQRWGFSPVCVR
jgi:hypothetical protein